MLSSPPHSSALNVVVSALAARRTRVGVGLLCLALGTVSSCIKRQPQPQDATTPAAAQPVQAAPQDEGEADGREATGNYGKVQGVDVLGDKGVRAFTIQGDPERLDAKWFPAENQPFREYIRAETKERATNAWDLQLRASNATEVNAGDTLLATFYFRTSWVPDESGEGSSEFLFELARDPWTKSVEYPVRAGTEWKQVYVPFVAKERFAPGEAQITFRLGSAKQVVEIAGVKVENFGTELALADLPKTQLTYPGNAADAPWRAEAAARIEEHRKGDFKILVQDAAGNSVDNATVTAKLVRHKFGFGTALPAEAIERNDKDDNVKVQQYTTQLFNMATLENDLKWQPLAGDWGGSFTMQRALKGVDWLNEQGLDVRGHVLVWPGWQNLPRSLRQLQNDKAALRRTIEAHIREVAGATKGKLVHWDVVNEPFTNHDVLDILGHDIMVEWFKIARSVDPRPKLYINDFAILSGGGGDSGHRDHYEKMIQLLVDKGAPFDGIGFQGHFGTSLTGMDDLKKLLDRYGKFGKSFAITEYDIVIDDQQLAADYTRDFYTMLFSYPLVEAIVMWGFWDGNHWKKNAALFNKDWTPKPAYDVYRRLVQQEWSTSAAGATEGGEFPLRGFYGEYEVTVTASGKVQTAKATLTEDGARTVINLP